MNFKLIKQKNITKTWIIMISFSAIVIVLGWLLSDYLGNNLFLYGTVAFSLISIWISYFKSDKIAIKSSGSIPIDLGSQEGQKLRTIVKELTAEAKLPMPKLYIMEEKAINAFATGRNPEHASISVTTGALKKLNEKELTGVLAHELTHIKNRDILVMTVVVSLAGILTAILRFVGQSKNVSEKKNPLLILITTAAIFLAPLATLLIKAAISRKREYMADAGSAVITKHPQDLASALEKIKLDSQAMQKKSLNTAHLFIASPYRSDIAGIKIGFFEKLFADHPPIDERIALLRGKKVE